MEQIISQTVEVLRRGGTILYPTDTIWGIGCDARNAAAVERLYAIKQRDRSKSMLVLVRSSEFGVRSSESSEFGVQSSESSEFGERSSESSEFGVQSSELMLPHTDNSELRTPLSELPRPTTYILPRSVWQPQLGDLVAPNLPADDGSLGIRVPQHDFCQQVISRLGAPLVSTSANLSGRPSPATYADIDPELFSRVDYCVPPLPAFLSAETRGSRILRLAPDGSLTVLRP